MEFKSYGFEVILFPKNESPYTGKEKIVKCYDKNIHCYKDSYGSFRFILFIDSVAVSALQMINNVATNVITIETERRKGYSERVFREAMRHFKNIEFSVNRSELGKLYVKKCEKILR